MNGDPPIAATPIILDLRGGRADECRQAAEAVSAELQLSRRWTRLVALSVRQIEDDGAQAIYEISVGQTAPLDWTLEGSTALRPALWYVREEDTIAVEAACDALADDLLCRLTDAGKRAEHRELVRRDLVRRQKLTEGRTWWHVRYNETGGPEPALRVLKNFALERQFLVQQMVDLVKNQNVRPSQICILLNGKKAEESLRMDVTPQLKAHGIELNMTRRESIRPDDSAITATTAHSFKGYDAELVWIFHAGGFALLDRTLGHPLYVAMTRAKSQLIVSGHHSDYEPSNRLLEILRQTKVDLREAAHARGETDREDIRRELISRLGSPHADWIGDLLRRHVIDLSPLLDSEGQIAHEPLFHFRTPLFHYVCLGEQDVRVQQRAALERDGYTVLSPGERYD